MDLIKMYRDGQIRGAIQEDQILAIWEQIKKEVPSLINDLDQIKKNLPMTEEEFKSFEEKIEIYSKLVNRLCRVHLRKEVPYFDKELIDSIDSLSKHNEFQYRFVNLISINEYALEDNKQVVFKTEAFSLFDILKMFLFQSKNDSKLFLYYLSIMDNKQSVELIKKAWTVRQYILEKSSKK